MPLVFTQIGCLSLLFFIFLNPLLAMQQNNNPSTSSYLETLDITEKLIITRYINPLVKAICIWPKPEDATALSFDQALNTNPLDILFYNPKGSVKKIAQAKFGISTDRLIILGVDKILSLWNLGSLCLINIHNEKPHQKTPSKLQFNSNRSLLALGFIDGSVHILDTATLELRGDYKPSKDRICSIVFSLNDLFLTATTHDTIFFWQLHENTFKILCKIKFENIEDSISITAKPSKFLSQNSTLSYKLAIELTKKEQLISRQMCSANTLEQHIELLCAYNTITKKIVCVLPGNQRFTGYFT